MSNKFEQISLKPGFMKHNGGVMFRNISDTEYEFKSIINENHLCSEKIKKFNQWGENSNGLCHCFIRMYCISNRL